jgi:hypothetical protein
MKYIISESHYIFLLENMDKRKRLFTKVLGEDLINSIQEITSPNQLPIGFLKSFGSSKIQDYIDAYGPLYYFVLDGEPFVYKNRINYKNEEYEMYINDKGESFFSGEIPEKLGIDVMGLKFSDVVDAFHNEGEPLNEETNESSKQIKFLKKFYDVYVSSHVSGKEILTVVRFIPKDGDNEMTPSIISSRAEWSIGRNGGLDFEDCTNIRNKNNQMPLLDYSTNTYYLDNYVIGLHRSEAKKRVS